MYIWIQLSFLIIVKYFTVFPLELDNHVKNYTLTSIIVKQHQEANLSNSSENQGKFIQISFIAFGEVIDFIATKTENSYPVTLLNVDQKSESDQFPVFYEKLANDEDNLEAFGYFQDKIFIGYVTIGNISYFLEPAKWYFSNNSKAIIYRNLDIYSNNSILNQMNENITTESYLKEYFPSHFSKRQIKETKELACEIEVTGDYTLYKRLGKSVIKTTTFLYLHVKYADRVFRATNFGTYKIRIVLKNMLIHTYPTLVNTSNIEHDAFDILDKFSLRPQNYCLSIYVLSRMFRYNVIGASYRASTKKPFGGICQSTKVRKDTNTLYYPNTGIITTQFDENKYFPLAISMKVFTHELGHAFGSNHDNPANFICSSNKEFGYYVMNSNVLTTNVFIYDQFSTCSIQNMTFVIRNFGKCLKTITKAACGNVIKEGKEECDCGKSKMECDVVDPCCTPSSGLNNDSGCTFRRSSGSECSPLENKCCESNCQIVKQKRLCSIDDGGCSVSYCNGVSKDCPPQSPVVDGAPCMFSSKTCSKGVCNSTVCLDNGFENCVCEEFKHSCHVCCRKSETNKCYPAWLLGLVTPNKQKFLHTPETSCSKLFLSFRCDKYGNCRGRMSFNNFKINRGILIFIGSTILFLFIVVILTALVLTLRRKKVLKRKEDVPPLRPKMDFAAAKYNVEGLSQYIG